MPNLIPQILANFLAAIWPLVVFAILLPLTTSTWLYYRREKFKKEEIAWILLELRLPREIKKSPRAMEQVLISIHSLRNAPGNIQEMWWDGEVTLWSSLEIVSFGGEIHFYIRLHRKYKDLVEAALLSYYPDIEVVETDDYVNRFPTDINELYRWGYNVWGGEMKLGREEAYPIRSYTEFEAPDEERQYDPISTFLEVLGKLKKEEMVGIQILIAPEDFTVWTKKWQPLVERLRQATTEKKPPRLKTKADFPGGPLPAFSTMKEEVKEEGTFLKSFMRTPGETDVLKAVENNLSKPAFNTLIRFVYLSPRQLFQDRFPRRGILGAFNQYGALDLNFFRIDYATATHVMFWNWPHLFPKIRNEYRKQRVLYNYRHRTMPPDTFMGRLLTSHLFNWNFASRTYQLNVESLATLYHPPMHIVLTAPHIEQIRSRRVGPPAGLAIYGEEEEIEKYQ